MMSGLNLICAVYICFLCHTVADEGYARQLVQKQKGDKVIFHCLASNSEMETLGLYMRLTTVVQVFNLYNSTNMTTITLNERFKSRLTFRNEINKRIFTIGNLTIEDSGVYWCEYSGHKKKNIEQGAILLFVNGEECDQSRGLGMPMSLILVSAVTAGSVLLLSLLILFIWVIPRLKAWRATMRPAPVKTNDVYEQMNNFRHA
ncbi:hypothetical protein UPYG_G00103150 [Umbra pygmaea]|uniref:Immunoglobulin domain-containing protein n=1 Tax=Umbra pygmaea TaxID=75934 RepID=A0ABD0X523_UMBPY